MTTNYSQPQQQYAKLINKQQIYMQRMEQYRLLNRSLKKEVYNLQALEEVVYSVDYHHKIDQAVNTYEQYEALQTEYKQLINGQKVKPQQLERIKIENGRLRQKITDLSYQIKLAQSKQTHFRQKQKMLEKYWQKYVQSLNQCEQQIEKLRSKHPFDQSMWRRLAKDKIKNMLMQTEDKQNGMIGEEEISLAENGRCYKLIAQQIRDVKFLGEHMHSQLRNLKQRKITSQNLKIKNDLASKTIGFDSLAGQEDDEQELRRQQKHLLEEIAKINDKVSTQNQQTVKLKLSMNDLARNGAIQKTKHYLQHQQKLVNSNITIVQDVLVVVEAGGYKSAIQAKKMRQQIKRIKQDMQILAHQVIGPPPINY